MTLRYRTHQNFEVKMNLKNSKLVRTLKDISPRLKWAMFSKLQDCKIASRYIDYLIPEQKEINNQNSRRYNYYSLFSLCNNFYYFRINRKY